MAVGTDNATVGKTQKDTPASIDPLAVMRIKDLVLRAKTVVEGFYNG